MNESKIAITPDFSKFFKAWVTINITSVYTNMLSFYEVASKLIVNLNNLKKAQNNSSGQMDSMVEQTEEYITYVRNYLTTWSANIHTEWDNFWKDRDEYEQNFLAKLKETYDNFIEELKQIESNFLSELQEYWSGKTTETLNTAESGMNDLISIYNKYKGKVDTWNTSITSDVMNAINDTKELMEQLQNKLTTFETEQKAIINSKNDEWVKLANNFYNEYKDVAQEKVDNTDLLEFVKSWGKNNPLKFNQNGLIIPIKYFGEETPSDMETGDLWYKPSMASTNGGLYKYNGTNFEVETLRLDKLYSYNYHLYYLTKAINKDIVFTVPNSNAGVSGILSYHDNLLYVFNKGSIYECNLETKSITNTWNNVTHLDHINTQITGNHTDIFVYANNRYYFAYDETNTGSKFYYVNSIADFVNKNFQEIEQEVGYEFIINNINGGYRNNGIFVPMDIDQENQRVYNASNHRSYPITLKGFYSDTSVFGINNINEFLTMSGNAVGTDGHSILPSGYGANVFMELNNIYNGIGFAAKNSFIDTQQYLYQDSDNANKYFITNNYYYKYLNGTLRRVKLSDNSVNNYEIETLEDMVDDYLFNVLTRGTSLAIELKSLDTNTSELKEIGYVPNV